MTAKSIGTPEVQTFETTIPGRHGKLDLSEYLTGEPVYDNRALSFDFVGDGSRENVLSLIDEMLSYHGQYITVTTDDYPYWYYTGRAKVTADDKGHYVTFNISVDAQPFRYAMNPRAYTLSNVTDYSIKLGNYGGSVIPTITVTAETTIVKGDTTLTLTEGTYEPESMKLSRGDNSITVTTTGEITITYREAVI